jgi:hypothetical protein
MAAERPALRVETEPFLVVPNTKTLENQLLRIANAPPPSAPPAQGAHAGPVKTITKHGGVGAARAPGAAADGAPSSSSLTAAATLTRRRYFPAEAIRAVTAPPPAATSDRPRAADGSAPSAAENEAAHAPAPATAPAPADASASAAASAADEKAATAVGAGNYPELSRTGVAACDHLAALVAQQLTHRAWQHARRQRAGTRQLTSGDVAAVASRGAFDFLDAAGVVDEWATPPVPSPTRPHAAPPPSRGLPPSHAPPPKPLPAWTPDEAPPHAEAPQFVAAPEATGALMPAPSCA